MTNYTSDQRIIVSVSCILMLPMILVFLILLAIMYRLHTKMWLVLTMSILIIFADLAWISNTAITLYALKQKEYDYKQTRIESGVTLMIASCFFSEAHFIFCFTYWECAQRVKLLLAGKNPRKKDEQMKNMFIILLIANILLPTAYSWTYTVSFAVNPSAVKIFFYLSLSFNFLLQLTSLFFLIVALWSINQQM